MVCVIPLFDSFPDTAFDRPTSPIEPILDGSDSDADEIPELVAL
jgi:hypothetical protein